MARVHTCEFCGKQLENRGGRPAKYCSATCRKKASRGDQQPVEAFRTLAAVEPIRPDVKPAGTGTALDFLIAQRDRLDRMLNECEPERAAALAKEYRETLREIEQVEEEQKLEASREPGAAARPRRSFDATSF